jgi:ABC-type bacteriocin/lantibiotic exporter with double-glycine peptidase domain
MKKITSSKYVKNFRFVISLIWQTSPKFICAKFAIVLVNTISPFIMIIFPKLIIDSIIGGGDWISTFHLIAIMGIVLLVTTLLSTFLSATAQKYGDTIQYDLVRIYGKKVMSLNYEDLENPAVLDMFEKSKSGFNMYDFFDKIVAVITNVLSFIGYAAILFTYSRLMLIIVVAVVVINLICNAKKNKYYYKAGEDAAPMNRKFAYLAGLMYGFDYAKEIKVGGLSDYITDKYDDNIVGFKKIFRTLYRHVFLLSGVSSLTSVIQTFTLYSVVAYSAIQKTISIGDFTMYISSISAASGCLLTIVSAMIDISKNTKYATDMRLFFEMERKTEMGGILPDRSANNVDIEFRNVSFKYPRTERYVLRHISFTVHSGEKISIVGKNGSGKTTLIKLLLRLYEPTEGEILVGGKNITDYDYKAYLSLFAPVLQDYKIFAFSCKENIELNLEDNEERLMRAIHDSDLDEKISSLPNGVLTPVYKQFDENGVEFSGGENQKLAIARAIYKDAPIILLDEPTANLDPLAEYDIYTMIYHMLGNKTSFFVSHRLASGRFCDRIFVVDGGEIIADGPHDSIDKSCELYREMFEKQAQFYIDKG